MISCQSLGLNGRFGNQMFQYATLYALGKDLKLDIGVPYQTKSPNDKLNFCLPECFKLSAKDSSSHIFKSVYVEMEFNYSDEIKKVTDDMDIRGYFQTEKYFKNYKKELQEKEFKFLTNIETQANALFDKNNEYIAVHMRLGDYLRIQECHPVCSAEYYKNALKMMPVDAKIILFSDDITQAKSILKDCGRNIEILGTNDKFVDMCMMTKCNYHVIANSSFSWWGAWLSNSKKIIAPKKWFGISHTVPKNWDDIYCDGWIII
jgi:hypothetical protein